VEQLHRKRLEILKFIARRATREAGLAPSVREIAKAVGLRSSQTVHHHLSKLEAEEYLERRNDRSRTLRLTAKGWEAAGHTPLLGRVAAGSGLEAIANEDSSYSLAAELLGSNSGRRRYVLEAKGDSMTGAGIEEGDRLLVEENEDPSDGAVVVALLRGQKVTVKRLHRQGESIRLRPQSDVEHEDLVFPAGDVAVQGEVVLVMHPPRR